MVTARKAESLDTVYSATSPDDVARKYDEWAENYDGEMASLGYRHPTICLALLCRHLPVGEGPILDAGAGTGLIGEWLKIVGYSSAEALDISEGMLEVAHRKGVYDRLHRAAMGQSLPLESDHFAGVVCAGVFTVGHVGAEGLDELARVVRPGGVIVLTVKDRLWEDGFAARVAEQARAGVWEVLEETPSYVSMPGRADTVPSRALALRVR
ncbi:class I SAM-dependent DNA methyltransferase [Aquibaculum arenosum]|uniref:Class I SAM-dependent methyltransferase n=1 Tax=Aquibaculum arenosum TaxID=3032591 RepID=A0ABT5YKC7_9PROT|nr:class I SAM-dependent methyltransferase [Fodinicurvata sp. CAU 1616]MDF2095401.1 class I SAM-dependent methyltransferase [Fodinicurvata sp. CAU 1616]